LINILTTLAQNPILISPIYRNLSLGGLMEPMVQDAIHDCDLLIPFLKVVSNTTRLKILCILNQGERRVGEIQNLLGAKQSYISQQLKYLKNKGYLDCRRDGTQIYYQLIDNKFPRVLASFKKVLKS
jgi:DNA-binding transcriptional ArsR family regulator